MLTLAEAKQQLNVPSGNTEHDDEITDYVDAVTAIVEFHTGEIVASRAVREHHRVHARPRLLLHSRPILSLSHVTRVDGSQVWDTADLHVNPQLGQLTVVTGPVFDGHIEVVVEAGHDPAPPNYNLAARIIVAHLWKTQRGVSGAPFAGGNASALAEGGMGFAVPRRAEELLGAKVPAVG